MRRRRGVRASLLLTSIRKSNPCFSQRAMNGDCIVTDIAFCAPATLERRGGGGGEEGGGRGGESERR